MTATNEPITLVVFRKWKDTGDVIALFPAIEGYRGACSSYMRVGQHSDADYYGVTRKTVPATEAEYAPLKRELEGAPFGYRFKVIRRYTRR